MMPRASLLLGVVAVTALNTQHSLSTPKRAAEHLKNEARHQSDLEDSATRWGAPIALAGANGARWPAVAAPRTVLTAPRVMPRAVAKRIKSEADARFATQTSASRFSMTEDLRDCHADELPRTKAWLRAFVASQRFTGAMQVPEASNVTHLAIYDALIVKYAPDLARDRAASGQPVHRDFSTLTLNFALSDAGDFDGGGTRFEGVGDVTLTPTSAGDAVAHAGRTRHAGAATTRGERYVLVCFLASIEPDHTRLSLARAMDLRRAGKYANAVRAATSALPTADPVDAAELHKVAGLSLRGLADACVQRRRPNVAEALADAAAAHLGTAAALAPYDVAALHSAASLALARASSGDDFRAAAGLCRAALAAARTDVERSYPAHDLALAEGEAVRLSVAVAR